MTSLEMKAESRALEIRNKLGFGYEPIGDIFNIIEAQNILLAIQPMKQDSSISAMFLNYNDNFLILLNSSKSLGHQYFSAGHELYHYFYDKNMNGSICNTSKFESQKSDTEKLADYFAVHFLMPKTGVVNYIRNTLKKSEFKIDDIREVIKCQHHFKVSFKAMLVRLKVLELIDNNDFERWENKYLTSLYKQLGFKLELIKPTYDESVPQQYLELCYNNYDNNKITFNAFEKYLEDVGLSPSDFDEVEEEQYVD